MPANLENSAVATGLAKVSFHSSPNESNAKECSNYHTIALISHARKVMLKILQARLQQYVNSELPDVQAGFRKGAEEPEIKLPTSIGSSKKQESSRKISTCFIDYAKDFDCVDHNKLENSSRTGNTRPPDLHSDFSGGRSGGVVCPYLSEFSTVYCDPHSQRL